MPAVRTMAARLYTALQRKLNRTLLWKAFDRSMRVRILERDGRNRMTSAAEEATVSEVELLMSKPMEAMASDGASFKPSPMKRIMGLSE